MERRPDRRVQVREFPASVFGGWRRDKVEYEAAPGAGFDRDLISIGVRWNFGADSLKSRDRTGASLTGASALSSGAMAW